MKPLYKIGDIVGTPSRHYDSDEGDIDYLKILDIEWEIQNQRYIYKFNNLEVEYWEEEKNITPEIKHK